MRALECGWNHVSIASRPMRTGGFFYAPSAKEAAMARHSRRVRADAYTATPFGGAGARVARLLVLDMVLWPGLLFVGGCAFVAWQVREHPVALGVLALATLFSAAVGMRQWGVMLRSVCPSAPDRSHALDDAKEAFPRLTGRGATER